MMGNEVSKLNFQESRSMQDVKKNVINIVMGRPVEEPQNMVALAEDEIVVKVHTVLAENVEDLSIPFYTPPAGTPITGEQMAAKVTAAIESEGEDDYEVIEPVTGFEEVSHPKPFIRFAYVGRGWIWPRDVETRDAQIAEKGYLYSPSCPRVSEPTIGSLVTYYYEGWRTGTWSP